MEALGSPRGSVKAKWAEASKRKGRATSTCQRLSEADNGWRCESLKTLALGLGGNSADRLKCCQDNLAADGMTWK